MTAVTEVTQPLDLPGMADAARTVRRSFAAGLVAPVLGGLVLVMVASAIRMPLGSAGLLGLAWVGLSAAALVTTGPLLAARPQLGAAGSQDILRAGMLAALVCWAGDAFVDLPVDDGRLVLLVLVAVGVSLLARVVSARFSGAPLRVVVVGEIGDRERMAAASQRLTQGGITAVASVGPGGLDAAVAREQPDAVLVVPGPGLFGRQVQRLAWQTERLGVPLLIDTRLVDVTPTRARPLRVGALSLVHVAHARRDGALRLVKHAWERMAAAVALLLLSPLLLLTAAAIRLDSSGPVFFKQRRVGRLGATFTMLKFRTMCVDAEARLAELAPREGHVLFKMACDPRVTRVGAFLRRYSLDELPQLINVVRGEMALVGPRPCLPSELAKYDDDPLRRLVVRPGLTGLWQVSGRSDLSWEESVRLDLDYVDNWSLGRDLAIVARTVRAVLGHSGAY